MNEVEAVKTKEEIGAVEALLRQYHGQIYANIWRIGVNLSLRISDLLLITYADLDTKNRLFTLIEGKTGTKRQIRLNSKVLAIVEKQKKAHPEDVYLFQVHSNRTSGSIKPISRVSVSRAFKDAGERLGLNINTHSMRKSRGWAMFSDGVPIEKISKMLNHSAPAVTMRYLGITQQEVLDTYDEYEL
ncbi:MAG: tyrosine-type recombinase/integrase [Gammaproteobacteria bacterium]|nr:tyrosine-type recombinase/integrase [Gammaproteobacteria bacterium]